MRALVWHGKEDVRYDTVTDPEIEQPRDAIVKVTSCAICGSDLHLFHNFLQPLRGFAVFLGLKVVSQVSKHANAQFHIFFFFVRCLVVFNRGAAFLFVGIFPFLFQFQ